MRLRRTGADHTHQVVRPLTGAVLFDHIRDRISEPEQHVSVDEEEPQKLDRLPGLIETLETVFEHALLFVLIQERVAFPQPVVLSNDTLEKLSSQQHESVRQVSTGAGDYSLSQCQYGWLA